MKKIMLYILTIFVMFIGINGVSAKKYTCIYSFTYPDIIDSNVSKYTFSVEVDTDKGTATKNVNSSKFTTDTNGWYITLDSSFNKFYEFSKDTTNGCVDAFAVNDNGTINVIFGNSKPDVVTYPLTNTCFDDNGFCSNSDDGGSGNGSEENPRTVVYCERSRQSRNNSYTWHFKFFTVNGTKKFKVWTTKEYESSAVEGYATGTYAGVGVGSTYIQIGDDLLDKIYSSECSDIKLYLDCPTEDNVTITGIKPAAGNNCSYSDAEHDNGLDAPDDGHGSVSSGADKSDDVQGTPVYDCKGLLGPNTYELLKAIMRFIMIIGPIIAVVLGTYDMVTAMASGEEDAKKKGIKKLQNRLIAVALLLLVPYIVSFILGIVQKSNCW